MASWKYRIDAKSCLVEFYCQEPKASKRGRSSRKGKEFFAVPEGTTVKWGGVKE